MSKRHSTGNTRKNGRLRRPRGGVSPVQPFRRGTPEGAPWQPGEDVLSVLPLAVIVLDLRPEFRLRYVSTQFEAMTGYSHARLLEDAAWAEALVPEEDRLRVREGFRRIRRDGDRFSTEIRVSCADGRTRWFRLGAVTRASADSRTLLLTLHDVSDRKAMELALDAERLERRALIEALPVKLREIFSDVPERPAARVEEAARLYRTLIEHIPGFVFVVRLSPRDSRLVYLSPQAEDFFRRPTQPFLSAPLTHWVDLVHPDDRPRVAAEMKRAFRSRLPSSIDVRFRMPDGSFRWTNVRASVISSSGDGEVDVLGVGHDVTAEREAEERSRRERELETQLMRADRLAAVGQLAAGIAHEVNNALASLLPYGSLLSLDPTLPETARDHGRRIEEQAHRIAAIVRGLLNLARQQLPTMAPWALAELVRDTLTLVGTEAKRADISVVTQIPDALTVVGDRGQLQQVILNLLSNAIQALADQPVRRLEISAVAERGAVVVRVLDSGPGVPVEIRDRLFKGFVTTRPHGSGLGLNISASIVKAHRGELWLDDTLPRGACFVLRLPAADAEEARQSPLPSGPIRASGRTLRALVIDDEAGVRLGFSKILERHGVTVETLSDGLQALEHLERNEYDLVFLDLRMPGMSGIDVFERLRQSRPGQADRIVLMTADAASLEVRVFLDSIRVPVLLKPFDIGAVREVIARVTSAPG